MDRTQRLAVLAAAILAASSCTMIGSPEFTGPRPDRGDVRRPGPLGVDADEIRRPGRPPPADVDVGALEAIPDAIPTVEPPSRTGNMAEYEQSGRTYRVLDTSEGYDERGVASWYGEPFHGRPTSSGETYDMYAMTAAHRSLPLPSYVEVTNLANGRTVILRVTDRGPFHDPDRRIIDVSYTAALKLRLVGTGTAPVRVRALEPYQTRREGGRPEPAASAGTDALAP